MNPPFYKPLKHSMSRRARWHDYRAPSVYMITLVKDSSTPDLATLRHPGGDRYITEFTEMGRIVSRFVDSMERYHPALKTWKHVIMPDHVHFMLQAKAYLPEVLGHYIKMMKSDCTRSWRQIAREVLCGEGLPFFIPDFNDRIIMKKGQTERVKRYIADNPRRLWIKFANPDLFMRRHRIVIDGREFEAQGNIFLLDDFDKEAVIYSSRIAKEKMHAIKKIWLHTIENGGVLVSPFIHQIEKNVRDYALANDGRIILFVEKPFPERYKPSGKMFDLCSEGRLLTIAPLAELSGFATQRQKYLYLNQLSRQIAAGSYLLRK